MPPQSTASCLCICIQATLVKCLHAGVLADCPLHAPGIAWDEKRRRLFVTGKWWHKLYQVKLRRSSTITLEKVRSQSWPGFFRRPGGSTHNHVLIYTDCYFAHVPSWPLAMCRRARHASLQRTAWAECCTEQPCLVGTGRSAQHVKSSIPSAHQASPCLTLIQVPVC
jgi:Glutamine cyclotransferase